jgi:site-specific DNA recombinase
MMPKVIDADPDDLRFTMEPAELVSALVAGRIAIDLATYPDANTALYARISLDRHDKTSVERQLEIDIAYAQRHRLPYVVFFDKGKSAYRKGVVRDDYETALNAIRARRLRRLVAYKIDRLYRQVEELMDIIKIANRGEVPVTLIGIDDEDEFDLTTAKGCDEAIGRVLEAQRESRRISERVRMERRKQREKGIPAPGRAAFGWKDKTTHDPETAEVVRQAYKSVLHGSSLISIARAWNAAGYRTGLGHLWRFGDVRNVLLNQRQAGRLTHTYKDFDEDGNKRTVTEVVRESAFDSIVDIDTFNAVKRILAERASRGRHPRRRGLLTGLVRCARCDGSVMNKNIRDGKPCYLCMKGKFGVESSKGGCFVTVNAEYLHRFVEDALFDYVDSPEARQRRAERKGGDVQRARLTDQRSRLLKRRDELGAEMATPDYDDELFRYKEDVRKIALSIKKIDMELALTRAAHPALEWAGNGTGLREAWKAGQFDDDQKRELIRDALGSITVHPATRRGPGFDPNRIEFGIDWNGTP